ncbi:hypothetical protein SAMN05192529_1284 [Arachidicoccus rhizosphaerae]|uniref:3-keto-disaccharide hydrolase domain-containing protein n=1 Tax=Arachidicoccus rhizosphaerae TaxID=551991 RepID=A0A1H4C701_9BACT|nr:hypothetical protein [Arachidicoccus rhizosphaerae]SEA55862.1 hypothetical protein SAMN05192529_1284 [Arachidicoccus rhizosphaerae]
MTKASFYLTLFLISTNLIQAQKIQPDIRSNENFITVNRQLSINKQENNPIIYLNAKQGPGIAWIKDIDFSFGTIEFDIKGKNIPQECFIGLAYHGLNDSTYDAIYFRPFNFNAKDTLSHSHAIQYISMPKYDWYNLRKTFKGIFENSLNQNIDPDAWFHVKINLTAGHTSVYVNNNPAPCLTLRPLNKNSHGKLGFWVGNGSDGYFSNVYLEKN